MKLAAIALIFATSAAGSVGAAERVTDLDYLKASRCKGLATSLPGVADPAAIDAFMKAATGARQPFVLQRADSEFDRARRAARSEDRKVRLTAELAGPCQAYIRTDNYVATDGKISRR